MLKSDFVKCVNHFIRISDLINDGWVLKKYKDEIYLFKSMIQFVENDDFENPNDLKEQLFIFEDDIQAANTPTLNFRKWEYHILYSISYQVPVIYFNVWHSNGELLSLDELWKAVNPNFRDYIIKNKWYTLTQQEHPYLLKPFFYFHPCHTNDFMNCFGDSNCNILITWLSSLGQIIWLNLNSIYGEKCIFEKL